MKKDQKYNVICFSNQLWDFPNWTNKKHVMSRLAKRGHNVIFVDPPINLGFVFMRQVFRGLWSIMRLFTQSKLDKEYGARIYTPINFTPNFELNAKFQIFMLKLLMKKNFDPELKTVLWVYHVQMRNLFTFINELDHDVLVYDCVDNYDAFPNNQSAFSAIVTKEELPEQEEQLTEQADLVFASAPGLVTKLKKWREEVYFTPNVGDFDKFHNAKKIKDIPEDIKNIKRPVIGFTGALDEYKFDMELFKKIITDHPSYSFVLIGQIGMKDKEPTLEGIGLGDYENVYFLGQKPYETLEKYYAAFDAFIIPYVLTDYTVGGCFPIKFHDTLAAGLPTIVTDMPAYIPFKDVCYIAKTYEEFSRYIEIGLKEDSPDKISARVATAKKNTWDGKIDSMLGYVAGLGM